MNARKTFGKSKRLTGNKNIQSLLSSGNQVAFQYPFRFIFKKNSNSSASRYRVLILVSKKKFPKATQRNRIKRQLRELFRLNQHLLHDFLTDKNLYVDIAISYVSTEKLEFSKHLQSFLAGIAKIKSALEKVV